MKKLVSALQPVAVNLCSYYTILFLFTLSKKLCYTLWWLKTKTRNVPRFGL